MGEKSDEEREGERRVMKGSREGERRVMKGRRGREE